MDLLSHEMWNEPWTSQCQQFSAELNNWNLPLWLRGKDTDTGRGGRREGRAKDTVSSSSRFIVAALENSNKPLIVGEHELLLLRGWQALDLCCPCCHILTLERGSEVEALNTVKRAITALFICSRGPQQSWYTSCGLCSHLPDSWFFFNLKINFDIRVTHFHVYSF